MNSAFSYQNDLTRSGQEMEALMNERAEHIKAIQAPGLLEKSKALQKRGQDVLKSAQDLQSAIEMGVGAPAGAAIGKQITNPAIKALADSKPGKFVSGKIDELGEKVRGVIKDVGKRAGKEVVTVAKKVPGWIKQAGSEARQGLSDLGRKIAANNAGEGEAGEPSVTQAFRPNQSSINDGGGARVVPEGENKEFDENDFNPQTAPRSQESMDNRGRDPMEGEASEGKGDDGEAKVEENADEAEEDVGGRLKNIFKTGEDQVGDVLDGPGANVLKGAGDEVLDEAGNIAAKVGGAVVEDGAEAAVGAVAAADAWNPVGWVLGIGLAIGSIVEGVNAAGDTAAANQQQHLADAVHLPKSPPINFAGKIVVPVQSAIGQE
jgi:hypothetical protein